MPASLHNCFTRIACALAVASLLGACATGKNPADPFESFNRGVYKFNERVDQAVLRPTARAYRTVVPQFVRQSVGNVFANVNDVRACLNNALQGKFTTAYSDFGRVAINSTLGVLGLFDVASEAGIEKHQEDFGQTLGRWGVADGPFIMLPVLGPSNARDTVGWAVDHFTDPITYVDPSRAHNQLTATRIVNRRAELLDASNVLDTVALDHYQFVRDAYLQRRRSLVYDGKPPAGKDPLLAPRPNTPQNPEGASKGAPSADDKK